MGSLGRLRDLRKVFPEYVNTPDWAEVAAVAVEEDMLRSKAVEGILLEAEAVGSRRPPVLRQLRRHLGRHLRRIPGSRSTAFCKWAGICNKAGDERGGENTLADNTDRDTAAVCRSIEDNMPYKIRLLYCSYLQTLWKLLPGRPSPRSSAVGSELAPEVVP